MIFRKKINFKRLHRVLMSGVILVFLLIFVICFPVSAADYHHLDFSSRDVFDGNLYALDNYGETRVIAGSPTSQGLEWEVSRELLRTALYFNLSGYPGMAVDMGDVFRLSFGRSGNGGWSDANLRSITLAVVFTTATGEHTRKTATKNLDLMGPTSYSLQGLYFNITSPVSGTVSAIELEYDIWGDTYSSSSYTLSYNTGSLRFEYGNPNSPNAANYSAEDDFNHTQGQAQFMEEQALNGATSGISTANIEIADGINDMRTTYGTAITACGKAFDYFITSDISHLNTKIKSLLFMSLGIAVVPLIVGLGINALRGSDSVRAQTRKYKGGRR